MFFTSIPMQIQQPVDKWQADRRSVDSSNHRNEWMHSNYMHFVKLLS